MKLEDYKQKTTEWLRAKSYSAIVYAASPIEKWTPYYSKPEYSHETPLREKAFVIAVCCFLDSMNQHDRFSLMCKELSARTINIQKIESIGNQLVAKFKNILSLYDKSEQLFVGYIRDCSVHGSITLWYQDHTRRRWYDTASDAIIQENIELDELRVHLNSLFSQMPDTITNLLKRMLSSPIHRELVDFYYEYLISNKLTAIGREAGVQINTRT